MKDFLIALLSSLGVLAQVGAVVLAACIVAWLVSPAARRALAEPRALLQRAGLWIAWAVAAVATAGSLWLSEGADFIPCRLCWFQRIFMYPLVIVLLVGALLKDRRAFWYAIPLPVIGLGIALYHVYIEHNPEAESQGCKVQSAVPCSFRWFEKFGYVTIPVLAASAFALIALLLVASRRREGEPA